MKIKFRYFAPFWSFRLSFLPWHSLWVYLRLHSNPRNLPFPSRVVRWPSWGVLGFSQDPWSIWNPCSQGTEYFSLPYTLEVCLWPYIWLFPKVESRDMFWFCQHPQSKFWPSYGISSAFYPEVQRVSNWLLELFALCCSHCSRCAFGCKPCVSVLVWAFSWEVHRLLHSRTAICMHTANARSSLPFVLFIVCRSFRWKRISYFMDIKLMNETAFEMQLRSLTRTP